MGGQPIHFWKRGGFRPPKAIVRTSGVTNRDNHSAFMASPPPPTMHSPTTNHCLRPLVEQPLGVRRTLFPKGEHVCTPRRSDWYSHSASMARPVAYHVHHMVPKTTPRIWHLRGHQSTDKSSQSRPTLGPVTDVHFPDLQTPPSFQRHPCPPPPAEEVCASARAHKRRSAQKAQEESGSSVA